MNNQKIKAFLIFIALVFIVFRAEADENKLQNALKAVNERETKSLISNSSNSILGEKKVEETF